jgi:hypothetical protein
LLLLRYDNDDDDEYQTPMQMAYATEQAVIMVHKPLHLFPAVATTMVDRLPQTKGSWAATHTRARNQHATEHACHC